MKRGIEKLYKHWKGDTAAKLDSERQNDAAAVQTAEMPEKYRRNPELQKDAADIKIYRIQRIEAINTAERQTTERGARYRKIKKNFRNRTKITVMSKYAKYVV